MGKFKNNIVIKLLGAIIIGILLGSIVGEGPIQVIATIKHITGQFIFFCVPLVIIGTIASSITNLKANASKMLGAVLLIAYLSSIGAAIMSMIAGYALIPYLNIPETVGGLKEIPALLFQLDIPPVMTVMTALVLAIVLGLTVIWTKSETFEKLLQEFNNMVLQAVEKMLIPVLPIFILTTFAGLAYEGGITRQLPVFLKVIVIVIIGHFIWMAILYAIAGFISKKNPVEVFRHYGPAYLTALGTMSSAATLAVALKCAYKSSVLDKEIVDFAIPIGSTIHLCGSVLTEVFFVMTISQILYGTIPSVGTMIIFIILLGVFAVGAPGVPGGTVMASLGIVTSILLFDDAGVALLISVFALQDSFGTACNITGDGAIALMLTGLFKKEKRAVS